MRLPRIKLGGKTAVDHCMSRIVGKQHLLDLLCWYKLVGLIKRMCGFCDVELIGHCVLGNDLQVLVRVAEKQDVSDEELIGWTELLYGKDGVVVQQAREGLERDGRMPGDMRQI